jgi:hypothetical protein
MRELISDRQKALATYQKQRKDFEQMFRRCDKKEITSEQFYRGIQDLWKFETCRLQGRGWEIKGKHGDFHSLSRALIRIVDAKEDDQDDVVRVEIDRLAKENVPARGAFLSEMLCLRYPDKYPVLNEPVWKYLDDANYRPPKGSSEGAKYIYLSKTLRRSLLADLNHPAKNLAELDTVIWLKYGKKNG